MTTSSSWRTPMVILLAGSLCALIAFGLRASLGLFLKPMSMDLGWGRETFAVALAIQNLMWGAFQPFATAAAEKWGTARIVALGGILYASGLYLMSVSVDPLAFQLTAGLMVGMAQSGCALAVVLGAVGRSMPENRRSWGLGIVTAAGAAGQFTVVPLGQVFLGFFGWSTSYTLLALIAVIILVCAIPLQGKVDTHVKNKSGEGESASSLKAALGEAMKHRGYWLLTLGFFVCGFHVAFIAVHLPAYLTDLGMPSETGAWSLSLIGLFNVLGAYVAGTLGDRYRKKHMLSYLYFSRSIVILIFVMMPVSTISVVLFSVAMGVLWLSTVPLTSGLVAQIFGIRYMGTLFAIVFLNHQIGSFLGIWLGGYLFDAYGTYMPVWWAGVALGVMAAVLHWPIQDETVMRVQPAE